MRFIVDGKEQEITIKAMDGCDVTDKLLDCDTTRNNYDVLRNCVFLTNSDFNKYEKIKDMYDTILYWVTSTSEEEKERLNKEYSQDITRIYKLNHDGNIDKLLDNVEEYYYTIGKGLERFSILYISEQTGVWKNHLINEARDYLYENLHISDEDFNDSHLYDVEELANTIIENEIRSMFGNYSLEYRDIGLYLYYFDDNEYIENNCGSKKIPNYIYEDALRKFKKELNQQFHNVHHR